MATSHLEAEHLVTTLFHASTMLAVDLEWDLSLDNASRIDMLQIGDAENVVLVHTAVFAEEIGQLLLNAIVVLPSIKALLASPNVAKVGVNIAGKFLLYLCGIVNDSIQKGDMSRLTKLYGWCEMRNLIDLSYMAQAVRPLAWNTTVFGNGPGMSDLVRYFLLMDLPKDCQLSCWSAIELSLNQIKCRFCTTYY
jgi:ribonuclease D